LRYVEPLSSSLRVQIQGHNTYFDFHRGRCFFKWGISGPNLSLPHFRVAQTHTIITVYSGAISESVRRVKWVTLDLPSL